MNQLPKLSKVTLKQHPNNPLNITVGVTVGVLFCLLIHYSSDFGFGITFSLGCAVAIFSMLAVRHFENESNLHFGYIELLGNFNLHELIQLTQSLELNDTERALIVKYLNEKHSGWSLSKSMPD